MADAASELFEREIVASLRQSAAVAVSLLALHPGPFVGEPTTNSGRDLADLLRHLAWIPKEQILLMDGLKKEQMAAELGKPIENHAEFAQALERSLTFFAAHFHDKSWDELLPNARGYAQSRLAWCLETLAHFAHHRHQLYEHLLAQNIVVPRELLQRLFPGHLVMSTPYVAD